MGLEICQECKGRNGRTRYELTTLSKQIYANKMEQKQYLSLYHRDEDGLMALSLLPYTHLYILNKSGRPIIP